MLIGINGGYFPAICRVCLKIFSACSFILHENFIFNSSVCIFCQISLIHNFCSTSQLSAVTTKSQVKSAPLFVPFLNLILKNSVEMLDEMMIKVDAI